MLLFERYLLKNYLKVLCLAISSFIALLLVSRLKEIAQFAALGAKLSYLALFVLFQISYVLPIAIPISCLLSSILLFQRLSHNSELTVLRASGLPLKKITLPLLIAGTVLSLLNFYITSELATHSRLATRRMIYDLKGLNPLHLLKSPQAAKEFGFYVQMCPIKQGKSAKDFLLAVAEDRLLLFLAKKIQMEKDGTLTAEETTLISTDENEGKEKLIIETEKKVSTKATDLAHLIRKHGWKVANDHLNLALLRIRYQESKKENPKGNITVEKCKSEMVRRCAQAFSPLTFTLMGIAFGMEISRSRTKRGTLAVICLAAFALIFFFLAKELDHWFWLSAGLFALPHFFITTFSSWSLNKIKRGIG